MQELRAVQAYADVKMLLRKESAPFVIQSEAVGLQIVPARPSLGQKLLLEYDYIRQKTCSPLYELLSSQ